MPVDSESWEEPPEGAQLPEDDAEGLSRSARKREAQALRALIEKAAGLGREDFAALTLPEELREALEAARALRPRSDERRRQLQFAARRLRLIASDKGNQKFLSSFPRPRKPAPAAECP